MDGALRLGRYQDVVFSSQGIEVSDRQTSRCGHGLAKVEPQGAAPIVAQEIHLPLDGRGDHEVGEAVFIEVGHDHLPLSIRGHEVMDGPWVEERARGLVCRGIPLDEQDGLFVHGSTVVIDHGNEEYSVISNIEAGSVMVSPGTKLKRGQLVGLSGTSGLGSDQQIHYHLQDSADLYESHRLPAYFEQIVVDDTEMWQSIPVRDQRVRNTKMTR